MVELVNLYASASGVPIGEGEISRFSLEERARAAAGAGFRSLSFWHTDLMHLCETRSLREIGRVLGDHGLGVHELEFLEDWFLTGERKAASDARKAFLLEAYAELGAHHLKVGDFRNTPATMPSLVDAFAALCEDAAQIGAVVGFEFMASAMLTTLEDSLAMVEGAGASNGGLIVDLAHCVALGISNDAVGRIPGRYLVSMELNDNLMPGTPGYDPAERRWCGQGSFDVAGYIAAGTAAGYRGPWAIEVFNRDYAGWTAKRLFETAWRTTAPYFS
jgi:sugar phosphate isomerase/epimerase